MAYDAAHGVTVLFGGSNHTSYNGETWVWNGTIWTQRAVSGPSPRSSHAMAFDAARGVTVLFGGDTDIGIANGETWEWNGNTWTQRAVSGPAPRDGHAMSYDSARGLTVLFGGHYLDTIDHYFADTWEWNGTAWTQRAANGPSARYGQAMAFDMAGGVAVLFGGYTNFSIPNSDTWLLHTSCYPNCDGSTTAPVLNILDFSCFLNRFASGSPYANCDHSTTPPVLNVLDFTCFLNQFAAGCN
jgi:hypothetical protein